MKDLCQIMEGKTNFSRRLKQFDGLTWLTLTLIPLILRQIYSTGCLSPIFIRSQKR